MALKNSLVEEDADIQNDRPTSLEDEMKWLSNMIKTVREGALLHIVAEVDERVVGHCHMAPRRGKMRHIGELGIMILEEFRDIGIGTEMATTMEDMASDEGYESMILEVFSTNSRAIHVYERLGYERVGVYKRAVKRDSGYSDIVMMQKIL